MKRYSRPMTEQSQKGSAAVEAAICIALILLPLAFFIFSFKRNPFGVQAVAYMTVANPFHFGNKESGKITLKHSSTMRHAGK